MSNMPTSAPDPAAPVAPGAPVAAPAAVSASTPSAAPMPKRVPPPWRRRLLIGGLALAVVVAGIGTWWAMRPSGPGPGFVSGNGRIEATEIDVAAKLGGRVIDMAVNDGDFVTAGQTLAHMQVDTLEAQRDEAQAMHLQAVTAVASAEAQVAARGSDRQAVLAAVAQRESELDNAQRRLARSSTLAAEGAASEQELDDDRASVHGAQAALTASRAQVLASQAAITAAIAQVAGARAYVSASQASIVRIQADIVDAALVAPRDARVQYRIAQPGEVLAAGGKALNLLDLGDVYMTFFVPEEVAGRLALGSEVHIILDAAPQYVIPTRVSFVAAAAQFTPRTVETASERQKLMFRVKAQFDRTLLSQHLKQVKTGLPGVAWIKLDAEAPWPAELAAKLPP